MEKYPLFKKEFLLENESELNNNFKNYLYYFINKINKIQNENNNLKQEIPLTFYPIAKNIRIVASFMTLNIINNKKSFIDNKARDGEEEYWIENKNMKNWYPWLWARNRIKNNFTCKEGWNFYFNSFNNIENNIEKEYFLEPPENLKLFFNYLACVKYTFNLNKTYMDKIEKIKEEIKWTSQSKILAVQIRRGETSNKEGTISDRPYFSLEQYIEKIDIMMEKNNFDYIYISTDSNEEINKIKKLRPKWKLLYLPIKRENFFRLNGDSVSSLIDLEVNCSNNPDKIPFIVDTALYDLYFISKCQGYISTMSISHFSLLGWYLQIAEQEKITPYINMNTEPFDMRNKNLLLFINLY